MTTLAAALDLDTRIAVLTEERDYWKAEAQQTADAATTERLRRGFGLTAGEGHVLGVLWRAGAVGLVRHERLTEDMPGKAWEDRESDSNTASVLICRLRKKLGAAAIETVFARGYRITDTGMALCARALEE